MNHKTWMQGCAGTVVAVAFLLTAFSSARAGRPAGPTPIEAEASGLAYNSTTNNSVPGDPDVAIGAIYAVATANDQVEFIGRAADGTLELPGDVMSDSAFWGTTAVDATGNASPVAIVALRGDGRVTYCGRRQGGAARQLIDSSDRMEHREVRDNDLPGARAARIV